MMEPGEAWYEEVSDIKYHQRFGIAVGPGTPYPWHVYDGGEEIVRFNDSDDAFNFHKQKNAEFPRPPKPPEPAPPLPIGTYYMLEASYYEIRQIVKRGKGSVGKTIDIARKYGTAPYQFAWGWFGGQDHPTTWEEKFIAMYDDREQALAHLRKLVLKH